MKKRRPIPVLCATAVTVSLADHLDGLGSTADRGADTQAAKAEAGVEKGKDESSGAKEEERGVVSKGEKFIIYSPLTKSVADSILAMFEEDIGIDAGCLAMGTDDALKKIQTEADNPQADILWPGATRTVKDKSEYFTDYTMSNENAFCDGYKNTEGNLMRFDIIPSVIMMNTDLTGDIRMEGYEDLLNPELKGKIALTNPAASSSSFEHLVNMFHAMDDGNPDNGWDYIEQFCTQLGGKLLGGSPAVYKGATDGEYTMRLTLGQSSMQHMDTDAPVKTVYMNRGVIFRGSGVYTIKGCLNKSSARRFVD